ncbi:MAG: 3-phosphoglycerate dehydrogenase [Ruminococcaceae bacterium]|nr:3-phosphoglycerate dehydrogenase [Oscillospiraceae bacterium]
MFRYMCLNSISQVGLGGFGSGYSSVDSMDSADALLVRSADMHHTSVPNNVKCVARAGAGVNNIPLMALAEQGIPVFNTPGANANGVKELVFAAMLLAARDVVGGINWTASQVGNEQVAKDTEKEKKKFAGFELSGKKLGVIGLGAIGRLVANTAIHLGMEVFGYDPYISVDGAWNLSKNVQHSKDIKEIYANCDYITIHVPLMDATRGMISAEAFTLTKPTAVLINLARDVLVDEQAVVQALEEGRLCKYVTDFPNPTVLGKSGVIAIPHLGASTEESEDNCAIAAVKQVKDFLENGNLTNCVNFPNCQMGICASASRVGIFHENIKSMISQFTAALAHTNIANMSNVSRNTLAYTLLDLEEPLTEDTIRAIEAIDGVYRVYVVK